MAEMDGDGPVDVRVNTTTVDYGKSTILCGGAGDCYIIIIIISNYSGIDINASN